MTLEDIPEGSSLHPTTVEFGDDEHEPQCVRQVHDFIFSGDEILVKKFLFVFLSVLEVRSSSSTMER